MKKIDDIPIGKNSSFALLSQVQADSEEWVRLPKPGSRLYGLSRTSLNELVVPCAVNSFKPPVRSVLLRKRGAQRGIRLIDKQSLQAYLNRLADEQYQSKIDGDAVGEGAE